MLLGMSEEGRLREVIGINIIWNFSELFKCLKPIA